MRLRVWSYFSGGVFGRAAEHEVFEEMGEAGVAGFDLVAGAGLDHDVDGDDVGIVGRDGDEAQAVGQVFLRVGVGKDLAGLGGEKGGGAGEQQG